MAHPVSLPDEQYELLVTLASQRNQPPESVLATLVDAAWEATCARYDAAFENDPDWQETARQVEAGELTIIASYPSTEAFLRHLGADEHELEQARRLDQESDDADA